jgi:hypothetical protein
MHSQALHAIIIINSKQIAEAKAKVFLHFEAWVQDVEFRMQKTLSVLSYSKEKCD